VTFRARSGASLTSSAMDSAARPRSAASDKAGAQRRVADVERDGFGSAAAVGGE